jgi:hypothetical protein
MSRVKASATGYKADPATYEFNKLRDRLRQGLKAVIRGKSSIASQKDWRAIKFLLWSAKRLGIDPMDGLNWNIDHLNPLHHHDLTTNAGRSVVNQPLNVRWLSAKENKSRQDTPLTEAEFLIHHTLVAQWQAETKSK